MFHVPRSTSYGVYISQLIRFARVSSHVDDLNTRNKVLTAKLLRQGYRYHKIRKAFSKFYRRHFDIVSKYNVGLKTLLLEGLSEPEFYGDLVYKFRKIIGNNDFPYQFKKIIVRYKKIGYNVDVLRQTACLVVNPIKVNKSRKENPQKRTQLSSRSHPRHLVGKRTAQKDITIDTTSDSQVNSNFPNRWSPASLTFNNYFYLFLYLYIT